MSNRRRARTYPPDVPAFIVGARLLGYARTDRVMARWADLLCYGFAAPDCTDEQLVEELAATPVFGDLEHVRALVALGRLHLIGDN